MTEAERTERERQDRARAYNRQTFPIFVCHHGNWDIYANAQGYCAALPIPEVDHPGGCHASHFGDRAYVRCVLGV